MIEFPPYRMDPRAERLWRGSQPVPLRPKAWTLLYHLAQRPGLLVTKEELHTAVWGDIVVSDDTVTRTVAELRRALSDDAREPRVIETVHRRGFRFIASTPPAPAAAESGAEPASRPEAADLIGRDAELRTLWDHLRQAQGGRRQVVFVQGEGGIGKSALVESFVKAVAATSDPVLIAIGQSVEQYAQREPYMPVLEALGRLSQGPFARDLLSAMRSVAPSWLAQFPAFQGPTDVERLRRWHADTTPHRMLREFSGLVEALAAERPLIIVLEDLHWSDQATVDLVSVLAQRTETARLMLVGTHRPAQAAALDHPIQQVLTLLRARRQCAEIALEYLTRQHVASYLQRRFEGSRVADEVVSVVHGHTDGNALFMILLVDHLLARRLLVEQAGTWRLTAARTSIEQEVPDNLRQLIEGQLRLASLEERDVLEVASVAGLSFDAPAVAAGLAGPADDVDSICHRLSRADRWLRTLGHREWPDGALVSRYAFQHALYQRTLYDRLSPGRRATLHEQMGRHLESAYAGRGAEVASELARHFQGGRDHARAVVYLEQAANQANDRHAYREVLSCIAPALRLVKGLPETVDRARDELRLRRLYASVLSQTAGYERAELLDNLKRTQALCEQLGDTAALYDALSALYLMHATGGDLVTAEAMGAQILRLAHRVDASAALQAHFLRGASALWMGDHGAAEAFLTRALRSTVSVEAAARPYAVNPVIGARSFDGLRRWIAGDAAGARNVQRDAVRMAEKIGHPYTVAEALTFSAFVLLLEGDWPEAAERAERVLALADEYGFPRWQGRALVIRGRALVGEGKAAAGLGEINEGLDLLRRTGLRLGSSLLLSLHADAAREAGRFDEGLSAATAGLAHCEDTGERLFEAELWRLRGEIHARRGGGRARARIGDAAEAEACRARARTIARAQSARMIEKRATARPIASAPRRASR
jgi:DNA-binding winged helix-turn-helix (wHTH) protein/tetratricopeptide (TPR) repeat protein